MNFLVTLEIDFINSFISLGWSEQNPRGFYPKGSERTTNIINPFKIKMGQKIFFEVFNKKKEIFLGALFIELRTLLFLVYASPNLKLAAAWFTSIPSPSKPF
ncbi:MAG: hypothetical protein Ct9H300mP3_06140 [Gammaproteobacteria bacterium]|nr:MAG: hypothetical protein Ct9H300mP3_06140 [Gammaproteobacteria bacterium]